MNDRPDNADLIELGLAVPLMLIVTPLLMVAWCVGWLCSKLGLVFDVHSGDALPRIDMGYQPVRPRGTPDIPPEELTPPSGESAISKPQARANRDNSNGSL